MAKKALPCPTLLRQLLRYDPETGKLFWKPRARIWFKSDSAWKVWTTRFLEQEAFTSPDGDRYLTGTIFGQKAAAHRVAYAIHHGVWPQILDHIDGDGRNNRLENIRSVDRLQNARNSKMPNTNTSGIAGVRFCRTHSRWVAQTRLGDSARTTRTFATKAEAISAREEALRAAGYHDNHGRTV